MSIPAIAFVTPALPSLVAGSPVSAVPGRLVPEDDSNEVGRGFTLDDTTVERTVNGALDRLAKAAAALDLASPDAAFRARIVTSSDAGAVTGTADPSSAPTGAGSAESHVVTVSQLAVAQANVGRVVSSTQATTLAPGTYTLGITQNGVRTAVSFTVQAGDTNATVLGAIANAVNGSGSGVAASVETTDTTSQLVLTAKATGLGGAFTVSDLGGGAVAATGAGTIARTAANASYTVDGIAKTSESNAVTVGSDVHLTLEGESSAPVTVSVEPDEARVQQAVADLASAYNAAVDALGEHPGRYPAEEAALAGIVGDRQTQLAAAGVGLEDGHLSVDAYRLASALASDPAGVRRALGVAQALRSDAETALHQPGGLGAPAFAGGRADARQAYGALATLGNLVDARV